MTATAPPPAPAKDIKSFEMIDPLAPLAAFEPTPASAAAPPPVVAAVQENKPVDPAPEPLEDLTPDDGPADIKGFVADGEPAAPTKEKDPKGLRKQLSEQAAIIKQREDDITAARKELEDERAKPRPDPAELDRLKQELESVKSDRQKEIDARNRASAQDHPDVMAIRQPFLEKVDDFVQSLSLSEGEEVGRQFGDRFNQMVNQRINLGSPGSEGYNDRQQQLMEAVNSYGGENRTAILSIITEGAKTLLTAAAKQKEISEDHLGQTYKDRLTRYGTVQRQFEKIAENYGRVDENLLAGDPLKPAHIVHKIITASEPARAAAGQVKNLIQLAMVPPPPIDPREEETLGTEAFRARVDTAMGHHEKAKMLVASSMYDAIMAMKILPLKEQRIAELEAQLAARHREAPKVAPVNTDKAVDDLEETSGPRDPRKFRIEEPAL